MSKPKFIHSFSTRPMLIDCYGIDGLKRLLTQVAYFSLSVAYLKRLGAIMVLHTDSLGKAVLGHLPYDEIKLTLDDMPSDINLRFWAAAKFVALSNETVPCIHIDGDVFIKNGALLDTIYERLGNCDIMFQSTDKAIMYESEKEIFDKEEEFCREHFCTPDGRDAFNTGLFGSAKDDVMADVVNNYLAIVRYFSAKYKAELDNGSFATPDLIAEQKMMEGIVRAKGLRYDLLLRNGVSEATQMGYQHVYTIDKHNDMPYCLETLKRVDPAIFEKTRRLLIPTSSPRPA